MAKTRPDDSRQSKASAGVAGPVRDPRSALRDTTSSPTIGDTSGVWTVNIAEASLTARRPDADPRADLERAMLHRRVKGYELRDNGPPKRIPARIFRDPTVKLLAGGFIGRPASRTRPMQVLYGPVVFCAAEVRSLTEAPPVKRGVQRIDYRELDRPIVQKARNLMTGGRLTETAALTALLSEVTWGSQNDASKIRRLRHVLHRQ